MITFKKFLEESLFKKLPNNVQTAWSERGGNKKEAVEWIIENNLPEIESGDFIYRGFIGGLANKISFIDSSTGRRMSRDSSGIYQLMMDASEAFKNYPSRSNSFICSTEGHDDSEKYGKSLIVFPKKRTQIAVAEFYDFWETGISGDAAAAYGHRDIESLTVRLSQLIRSEFNFSPFRGMTMTDLDKAVSNVSVDEFLDRIQIKNESIRKKITSRIEEQGGKNYFTALSNIIATPSNFGVDLITYGASKIEYGVEIWFSGEALIVHPSKMEDILKELPEEINIHRAMRALP